MNKKKFSSGMVEKPTLIGRIFDILVVGIVIFLALICVLPMWHVLMSSISDGFELLSHKGVAWLPVGRANLEGYKLIFRDASVASGYFNTIIYVVGATLFGFVINILGGYALSQATKLRTFMTLFLLFAMMFSGGMIPTYMVMDALGLVGSRWSVILLEATQSMYIIMVANAFRAVPKETVEAARMDGAGHLRVMFQIMLPQSMGMTVVTVLYTVVAAWNSWLNASIYLAGQRDKWPIQLVINELVAANQDILNTANPNYSRYLIQFAVIAAATLPILIAFPFFQKQFEKGAIQGGVKE